MAEKQKQGGGEFFLDRLLKNQALLGENPLVEAAKKLREQTKKAQAHLNKEKKDQ